MDLESLDKLVMPEKSANPQTWRFRLYIAGNAPNSLQAISNIKRITDQYLSGKYNVEIIDVLKEPLRTLEDSIYVTPTLIRLFPEPHCKIIGSLSDENQVLLALGLMEMLDD